MTSHYSLKLRSKMMVYLSIILWPFFSANAEENVPPPPTAESISYPAIDEVSPIQSNEDKAGAVLNLMDVYELSLVNDPKLKEFQQRNKSASEEIKQARSGFFPQFRYDITTGGVDGENNQGNQVQPVDDSYELRTAQLEISQTLFNKEIGSRLDSAKISSKLASIEQDIVLQQLQLDTAIAYLDLLRNKDQLDAAEKQLATTQEQFNQAKERFDVGVGTITDFYQAQSRLSLAQSDIVQSRNEVSDAQQALLALTGLLITDLYPLSDEYPVSPPSPNNLSEWLNTSMSKNLSLLLARETVKLSDEQIDLAKAEYWPSLNLIADQDYRRISESQFLDGNNDTGRVFLQLQGKLYQGGRLRSQVKQAQADHLASMYSYDDVERLVRQGTTNAFNDVQASIRQVQALNIAYLSAEKTLQAREETYQVGLSTNLEVLDAIRDWFQARNNFLSARYQHAINLLSLKLEAGTLNVNDIQELNRWTRTLNKKDKSHDTIDNVDAQIKKINEEMNATNP